MVAGGLSSGPRLAAAVCVSISATATSPGAAGACRGATTATSTAATPACGIAPTAGSAGSSGGSRRRDSSLGVGPFSSRRFLAAAAAALCFSRRFPGSCASFRAGVEWVGGCMAAALSAPAASASIAAPRWLCRSLARALHACRMRIHCIQSRAPSSAECTAFLYVVSGKAVGFGRDRDGGLARVASMGVLGVQAQSCLSRGRA